MSEPTDEKPTTAPSHETLAAIEHALEKLETRQKKAQERDQAKNAAKERLTNRVSIAAICLTMLMSFLNFARAERDGAAGALNAQAAKAQSDAEANWAYYQTREAERAEYAVADDTLFRDVVDLPDSDPRARTASAFHAEYAARQSTIDHQNQRVFWVVQDLRRKQIRLLRSKSHIDRQIDRYDMGTRVLTLAVVLLSVTLLANRAFLFWIGASVALLGAAIATNGYFLLF